MSDTPTKISGRAWVVTDADGRLIDDIDTDMIFHNAHLAVTDVAEMGQYTFGNLEGWEDFPDRAAPGDVVVVGGNFGSGSSRQQAVDCFRSLGVRLVIAESFGAIYRRNAINSGMPILSCPGLGEALRSGDVLTADLETGELSVERAGAEVPAAAPMSEVQLAIYRAGDLFAYARSR